MTSSLRMPVACLAAVASAVIASSPARAARGTDISAGYEWFDTADGATTGPGFFDGPVTQLNPADDAAPTAVTLPWPFPFYGGSHTQLWVSDNGWISFADPLGDPVPTSEPLPSPSTPQLMIAPFWSDLDASNASLGRNIRHGRVNAFNAYRFQFSTLNQVTGQLAVADVYLYQDGRIKFHYIVGSDYGTATIGIENADGTDGFSVVSVGVPAPGVPARIATGYAVDIIPPPVLAAECAAIPSTACTTIADALPGALPGNVVAYACGTGTNLARERVYSVTLAGTNRFQATLTPGTARNLRMYLLDACNERRCLRGPGTSLDVLLGAGTYYVAVDAPTTADEGTFTLQLDCAPLGTSIACGDTVSGTTSGGSSFFTAYPCAPGRNLSGREAFYALDVASSTNLRATLTASSANLDVLVLAVPAGGVASEADCVAWGDGSTVLWGAAPGQYLVVVDGVSGVTGTFTLETECVVAMDCSTLAGTIDFTTSNRQDLTGDTTGGANAVDVYQCDPGTVYDGPEAIYELVLPRDGQVGVYLPGGAGGLTFFVLDACNEGSCVGSSPGGCSVPLSAGTHYLVVDGASGASGPFTAQLALEEPFHRWSDCEDPDGGTTLADTENTVWEFDDGAYCYTDPASINYPDGCDFAMYVTARCGTELHIPLFDVESGHLRVYDVFRDEYVLLTAQSTGGGFLTGTDIQWEDCAGTSAEWNEETTDIWFERPEGLCGVYRIEFPKHSGFIWDLYANCSGLNVEGFTIYDSLCGALANYEPLPNLGIASASAVTSCPDITVTYTIENNGCAQATNAVVTLLDNGTPVATDVVALVDPGTTVTQSFTATFPGGASTSNVTLVVDQVNAVLECEETPGAGCALRPGVDVVTIADCGPACDVFASAVANPAVVCSGGTLEVDASATTSAGCPGDALEYRLTGPGGTIGWQSSPVFAGLLPAVSTDYDLDVRCADPLFQGSCVASTPVHVDVDRRPVLRASSAVASEVDCALGVRLDWDDAIFFGPTGTGAYNVYRSTVSCADAVTPGSTTGGHVGSAVASNFEDLTTAANVTYYYVIEAEDSTTYAGGCMPRGPSFGGAVTRVDVSNGACSGVVDRFGTPADQLPKVGGSLRVGAPDAYDEATVPLRWSTDAPLDVAAGEHFHVLRSGSPSTGFTQINVPDPPLLQTPAFTDVAADQPDVGTFVWYYVVFVANQCHLDNRLEDPSAQP